MGVRINYKEKREKGGLPADEVQKMLNLNDREYLIALCRGELTIKRDKTISFGNVVKYSRKHNIKFNPIEYARRMSKINAEII